MKAARIVGPRQIEITDVEDPKPREGEVLVKMVYNSLCGSDYPSFTGLKNFRMDYPYPPGYPGHEAVGIVVESHCEGFEVGDRALVVGYYAGTFMEYITLPGANFLKLPPDGDLKTLMVGQLLGTIVHAFYKLGNVINQKVVVLGQGSVGLLFDGLLRLFGARMIIGVDLLDYRLETAKKMGATHTVNPSSTDLVQSVTDLTRGEMADLVVEAVGKQAVINQALDLVRRNGTMLCFGVPMKDGDALGIFEFRYAEFFRKELKMIGSVGPNPPVDFPIAIDLI
ncbi:MAG: zinc-binding dehydrogenase, partial [Candidatus Tectomicrobia bacterium]|nr:zinc-binding dehydrogenase [Candidatus Tectomicrobia bacterium]